MASFWLEFEQDGVIQKFPFDGVSISIGRDKSADFTLDHPTISRQHALIVFNEQVGYSLVVLSRGGLTAINGESASGTVDLYEGDRVHLGKLSFTFHSHNAAVRPESLRPEGTATPGANNYQVGQGGAEESINSPQFGSLTPEQLEAAVDAKKDEESGSDFVSWDDIAQSAAAQDESDDLGDEDSDNDSTGASPLLVVGGGAIVILVVVVAVLAMMGDRGTSSGRVAQQQAEVPPVEIRVDCVGEAECMRVALNSYRLATELLARREVEISNLFEGYKRLLEAEKAMEIAGVESIPEDMLDLIPMRDEAREELDGKFQNLRVRFHQQLQVQGYGEMAHVLISIKEYFPDATAREHQWANARELEMKRNGTYPVIRRR